MKKFAVLLMLIAAPAAAQRITGVAPGTDSTVASLLVNIQPVQTIQQAFKTVVVFGPPMTLTIYKGTRLVNGIRVGVSIDSLVVGETGCLYAIAKDRFGNEVPGLGPVTYSSANPAVLSISSGGNCPTTTVRLTDIPIIP